MTRFVPVTVLVMLLAMDRTAGAQVTGTSTGSLPNGATIVFKQRAIYDEGSKTFTQPTVGTSTLLQYFNLAHCNCAKAAFKNNSDIPQGTFNYLVQETATSQVHKPVDYWAGTTCDQAANRPGGSSVTCRRLTRTPSDGDLEADLYPGGNVKNFNLYEVVNGTMADGTMDCQQLDAANNSIYALVDTVAGSTTYNYSSSVVVGTLPNEASGLSGVDTRPPTPIKNPVALAGENVIDLSWDTPDNAGDVAYYQALCATVPGGGFARSRSNDPRYVTTATACGSAATPDSSETPSKTPLNNGDMAVDPPNNAVGFFSLDPNYICGEASGSTTTSLTIKGLQNNMPYQVMLLVVDLHGNFRATYFDHAITPVPVTDFWEELHQKGSKVEGGLCLLAETYGDDSGLTGALRAFRDDTLGGSRAGRWLVDAYYATLGTLGHLVHGSIVLRVVAAVVLAPLVAVALLWHWLTLPGLVGLLALAWWLRRRWRRVPRFAKRSRRPAPELVMGALIVVIALGAGPAHAGGFQPYWDADPIEEAKQEAPPGDPSLVNWHVGLRFGPYIPDVDSQISASPGPYQQMFGTGYHVLAMLDVQRILWTGYGQIGVGLSGGYWQKTARPFTADADLSSPNPARQPGKKTAFKLIPTELTATYRFTVLDDNYGIPVVPYARAGLAYYVWWVTKPSGSYARLCDTSGLMCTNKALGASAGLVGAIGVAIRGERIDAATAMSMQQSGIQHAGIYAELSVAKVDGFGADTKLAVGDATWFAGIDFEF